MTSEEFTSRLRIRAERAAVSVSEAVAARLEAYFRLLATWNRKINLTALPLDEPTDETFDRLFIEPLVAAKYVGSGAVRMLDVGSGGGSPAIPLAVACSPSELLMVESRSRKAVFLAEAARAVGLSGARVASQRLEQLAEDAVTRSAFELVTMRAVRLDREVERAVLALLAPGGTLMVFGGPPPQAAGFVRIETHPLLGSELILATKA